MHEFVDTLYGGLVERGFVNLQTLSIESRQDQFLSFMRVLVHSRYA